MNKGLEALEKAKKRNGLPLNQEFAPVTEKEIEIIEQELKEGQLAINIVNRLYDIIGGENDTDIFLDKVEKQKKALEVIKEKIKFEEIKAIPFNNYTEYYVVVNNKEIVFSQEEYDLLKEVLL